MLTTVLYAVLSLAALNVLAVVVIARLGRRLSPATSEPRDVPVARRERRRREHERIESVDLPFGLEAAERAIEHH
jgi:hypothetical protein